MMKRLCLLFALLALVVVLHGCGDDTRFDDDAARNEFRAKYHRLHDRVNAAMTPDSDGCRALPLYRRALVRAVMPFEPPMWGEEFAGSGDGEWQELQEYIEVQSEALEHIREAAACDQLGHEFAQPLDPLGSGSVWLFNTYFPELTQVRRDLISVLQMLEAESRFAAGSNDAAGAADALATMARLAEQAYQLPHGQVAHYTYFVAIPSNLMAGIVTQHPELLSERQLDVVQRAWERFEPLSAVAKALEFDHANFALAAEGTAMLRIVENSEEARHRLQGSSALIDQDDVPIHAEWTERALKILRSGVSVPLDLRQTAGRGEDKPETRLDETRRHLPSWVEFAYRTEAHRRVLIVGVASERYRLQTGAYPSAQVSLVQAGLLGEPKRSSNAGDVIKILRISGGVVVFDPDQINESQIVTWMEGGANRPDHSVAIWKTVRSSRPESQN